MDHAFFGAEGFDEVGVAFDVVDVAVKGEDGGVVFGGELAGGDAVYGAVGVDEDDVGGVAEGGEERAFSDGLLAGSGGEGVGGGCASAAGVAYGVGDVGCLA